MSGHSLESDVEAYVDPVTTVDLVPEALSCKLNVNDEDMEPTVMYFEQSSSFTSTVNGLLYALPGIRSLVVHYKQKYANACTEEVSRERLMLDDD